MTRKPYYDKLLADNVIQVDALLLKPATLAAARGAAWCDLDYRRRCG